MGNKDLAKHYSIARLQGRLSGNEVSFSENKVFTEEDIEAAFNAGRESVIGDIPDLEWGGNHDTQTARCVAGVYIITMSLLNGIELTHNLTKFDKRYGSFASAKQAAKEHYKELIKQALGL